MTSSSASEASPAASPSWGRQEDAKDSACPMPTSCQPLAKPRRRLLPPLGHLSSPQDLATFPSPRQEDSKHVCLWEPPSFSTAPQSWWSSLSATRSRVWLGQKWEYNHQHPWPRYKELITAIRVQEGM